MTKCETCGKLTGGAAINVHGCVKCGKYFHTCHNCERNSLCKKCKVGMKSMGMTTHKYKTK